jgi:hypothetical protein
VQGRFRREPEGRLFLGAEVTKRMELGLLTKGLCNSILQVTTALSPAPLLTSGGALVAVPPLPLYFAASRS